MSTPTAAPSNSEGFIGCLVQYVGVAHIGEHAPAALAVTAIRQISGIWGWIAAQFEDCYPETPVVHTGLVLEHLSVLDAAYQVLQSAEGVGELPAVDDADLSNAEAACSIWKALSDLRDLVGDLRAIADSKKAFPQWAMVVTVRDVDIVLGQLRQIRFGLLNGIRLADG